MHIYALLKRIPTSPYWLQNQPQPTNKPQNKPTPKLNPKTNLLVVVVLSDPTVTTTKDAKKSFDCDKRAITWDKSEQPITEYLNAVLEKMKIALSECINFW